MSIYTIVAAAVLPILPQFTELSTSTPTLWKSSNGDAAHDPTIASDGTRTLYVIPAKSPFLAQAFPGVAVYACDYFVMGALSQALDDKDVLTDGTRAFVVTGAPNRDFGLILAPAARANEVPAVATPGDTFYILLESGDALLTEAGDHLLLEAA